MTKRIYLLLVVCLSNLFIYSQSLRFTYDLGYGIYSLKNVKQMQTTMLAMIPELPIKRIVEFPNYLNHSVSIGFYLNKNNVLEINGTYLTTGGRNHLRDYSGEYKLDMILDGYQVGAGYEHIFNLDKNFDLNTNFGLGVVKSTLDISEHLDIYNIDSKTSIGKYTQTSLYFEPNLSISYKIIKGIAINLGIGYNLNSSSFNNKLIDWSGMRSRIGILCSY